MIYLDYNATSPLDPTVLEAMLPFFKGRFGNAQSRHTAGRDAREAVENARCQVAAALAADPREIHWTSGATESNNLALLGLAASPAYTRRRHLVTTRTEHPAILDPCRHLESRGYEITYLGVDRDGRLDLDELDAALRDDTLLVSVMHANNEVGTLHPIADIGHRCRARGVLLHTDATQTFGKLPIDVTADAIDLLSFSAHKLCGPKGTGGLYLRRRDPRVRCAPLLFGGGHERGLRPGTLDVPAIVGLGRAAELACRQRDVEQPRLARLRDRLEATVLERLPGTCQNGAKAPRLAGTSNLAFPGVDATALLDDLPELALSTASACASAARHPSYVLGAMGLSPERVDGSVRASLGRFTTESEVDRAVELLVAAVERQRGS